MGLPGKSSTRRLCHVFSSFDPGGAEVRTATVINGLPEGYDHTVIALNGCYGCMGRLVPGVPVTPRHDLRKSGSRYTFPWRLGRLLREMSPDLLITYNWGSMDAAVGAWTFRVRPWMHVEDGFQTDEAIRQKRRRVLLRRFLFRRAGALVVVSNNLARIARSVWKVPDDVLLHIPNGIDTTRFTPGSSPEARRSLGLADGDVLIGCVAHLRGEKNPLRLLDAFGAVAGRFAHAHLVFIGGIPPAEADRSGGSPRRANLLERTEGLGLLRRVHFVGSVAEPLPWYRALDVFALSSDSEQMPLSIAEAMACGLPVVSTDVGDIRWMVSDENRQFVRTRGDEPAYAEALAALLCDEGLRRRLGQANRERAQREFERTKMISSYRDLYERLCRR